MSLESKVFNLREGERVPLLMAALAAFLSVATVVFGRSLSDAILLSVRPAVNVATFFIYSSVALMAVSLVYYRLIRRVSAVRLNAGFLILFSVCTILFESLKVPEPWFVSAYATFLITAPALGNIIVWNAIGDAFNVRQGRRLFHIVSAASTVGGIVAGFMIPPLLKILGFTSLPVFYSLMFAGAVVPVWILHRNRRAEKTVLSAPRDKGTNAFGDFMSRAGEFVKSPLIRNLSLVFFFTAVTTNIIDFSLKMYLQTNYDQNGIATFYGHFNAISNTFNLIVQLTLLSSFLTRFSARTLFALTPAILLIFSCPLIFVYSAVCVVLLRFMDVALRFVIQDSAREIALSPLPRLIRNRAKVIFKGMMNPLGGIFTGLALYWLAPMLSVRYLPLLIIPVALTSLFCIRNLNKYCASNLYSALQASASREGLLLPAPEHDDIPADFEHPSADSVCDGDENVRSAALDSLLLLKANDEDVGADAEYRKSIQEQIRRDIQLAHATLLLSVDEGTEEVAELYESAVQRVFRGLMVLHQTEVMETIYHSLTSTRPSTKAQALELLQLTLSGEECVKPLLILCDSIERAEKCSRLAEIQVLTPQQALGILRLEESRRCRRVAAALDVSGEQDTGS